MAIGFQVGAITSYIPGVYSTVVVESDLKNVTPSPRNILVLGEADEGAPFDDVDMRANYFTDFASVKAAYSSGPIVDACSQLFSNQPNPVFGGQIGRVYVAKTNQSTQASKTIASPSGYGSLEASVYGESGNFIRAKITDVTSEAKPTSSFTWIPGHAALNFNVFVSGVNATSSPVSMDITTISTSIAALGTALTGEATVVGSQRTVISGTPNLSVAVSGGTLTITCDAPWSDNPVAGDTLVIPVASGIKGASDKNIGVYVVTAATNTTITAVKIKSFDTNPTEIVHVNPEAVAGPVSVAGDQTAWATAEFIVIAKMSLTVTNSTVTGAGATMEIAEAAGAIEGPGSFIQYSALTDIISQATSTVASIAVAVNGADVTVSLTDGTFSTVPAAGDLVWVPADSVIAGTLLANVGTWVVKSATASSIVLNKTNGLTPIAVSSVFLNGSTSPLKWHSGVVSNSLGGKTVVSATERSVKIEATQTETGTIFPTNAMGGEAVLEVSFYDATVTVASVSIDNARRMTFTFTASPTKASITIYLNKYATLRDLVNYINTLTGFSARVANSKWNAYPTTILDCVQSLGILSAHAVAPANVARIKADYWAWTSFISGSASIVEFKPGTLVYKAGLPAADTASYLSGGALGATTDTNVSDALTAGLLLPVRQVLPCFSRDARYDVEEGFTDPTSTYTIAGINAAVSGHVSTASSDANRHERLGMISFHGSFEDSKAAAASIFNGRCQMAFQQTKAIGADGSVKWFLPWMLQACIAAGRSQAILGTSMLRKNFRISGVRHIGNLPTTSTDWTRDFDMENSADVTEAIQAGLVVIAPVPGSSLKMVSPDCSTRSEVNSPTAWFYERISVQFTLDEVLETCRNTVENFIGSRTSDVTPARVSAAVDAVLANFVSSGALIGALPSVATDLGNGYTVTFRVRPAEALEFVSLTATVTRDLEA